MKAKYQKPNINALTFSLTEMIAFSQPVENGQNLDSAPTTTETSGNLSRRRSVWDDDEPGNDDDF